MCERDDHAIEWIAVNGKQRRRRACNGGIKRHFAQIISLGERREPLSRGLAESKLPARV